MSKLILCVCVGGGGVQFSTGHTLPIVSDLPTTNIFIICLIPDTSEFKTKYSNHFELTKNTTLLKYHIIKGGHRKILGLKDLTQPSLRLASSSPKSEPPTC